MDGKIVQPDDKEAVITQAEHRIKMSVQRDADERWERRLDHYEHYRGVTIRYEQNQHKKWLKRLFV